MKKIAALTALAFLASGSALAKTKKKRKKKRISKAKKSRSVKKIKRYAKSEPVTMASGLTLGIIVGNTDVQYVRSDGGNSEKGSGSLGGFKIGYSLIRSGNIGFIGSLNRTAFEIGRAEVVSTIIEANMAYGFTDIAYGFGGFNQQNYSSDNNPIWDSASSGTGYQLGVGFVVSELINLDIKYQVNNNEVDYDGDFLFAPSSGRLDRSSLGMGINFVF